MIDEHPIQTAQRKSRRKERPRCLMCWCEIIPIEQDHVAGKNHDPEFTAPLCRICHSKVTEERRRADAEMRNQASAIKRVKYALRAISVFLQALAKALGRLADLL
jgi:hypothetical protein